MKSLVRIANVNMNHIHCDCVGAMWVVFVTKQVQMVKDIQQASRQLGKRQMTWFRDDPMYLWLDAKQPVADLVDHITASLQKPEHIGMLWWFSFRTSSQELMSSVCQLITFET